MNYKKCDVIVVNNMTDKVSHDTQIKNLEDEMILYFKNIKRDLDIQVDINNKGVWHYLQIVGCIQELRSSGKYSMEIIENVFRGIYNSRESPIVFDCNPRVIEDVFYHMSEFYEEKEEDVDVDGDGDGDRETLCNPDDSKSENNKHIPPLVVLHEPVSISPILISKSIWEFLYRYIVKWTHYIMSWFE